MDWESDYWPMHVWLLNIILLIHKGFRVIFSITAQLEDTFVIIIKAKCIIAFSQFKK